MEIRSANSSDARSIAAIYNHFVRTSVVTFEEEELPEVEMASRIEMVEASGLPWYVVIDGHTFIGYAYATPWKDRSAYRYSVEITIYLAPRFSGKGIGTALYGEFIPALRRRKIHSVLAGIALPNPSSIALHERFGFSKVAHLMQVGFKMNGWIDVGYWLLIFENASL